MKFAKCRFNLDLAEFELQLRCAIGTISGGLLEFWCVLANLAKGWQELVAIGLVYGRTRACGDPSPPVTVDTTVIRVCDLCALPGLHVV